MKKTIVSTNWLNKVIAAMMMMAITFAMPAMAGHKTTVSTSRSSHFDTHKTPAYRPDVKTTTIKVSRHDSHKKVVAKVENVKGVKEAKWNPRTREVTVVYDANVTSVRNIKHFMA